MRLHKPLAEEMECAQERFKAWLGAGGNVVEQASSGAAETRSR